MTSTSMILAKKEKYCKEGRPSALEVFFLFILE